MAKLFMEEGDINIEVQDGIQVYGSAATTDSIVFDSGDAGVVVDQNVEQVKLDGSSDDYTYQRGGNTIKIYSADGLTLIATVAIQADGTDLTFADGTVAATLEGGVMKFGGTTIPDGADAGVYVPGEIDETETSVVPGETYVLETTLDDITAGAFADTFKGTIGPDGTSTTYNTGDFLDGGQGTDSLIVTVLPGAEINMGQVVEMVNIEDLTIRNFDESTARINGTLLSGFDSFTIRGGTAGTEIYNLKETFTTLNIENFGTDLTNEDTVSIEVADTVFTGTTDAVTINLNNVGAGPVKVPAYTLDDNVQGGSHESIDGEYAYVEIDNYSGEDGGVIETFNIVSGGTNTRGNFLQISNGTDVATTLNISGSTDLFINFTDGDTAYKLETVDASALNANLFLRGIDSDAAELSITGAQGDNDIAGGDAAVKTITTFAGNDVIRVGYGEATVNAGNGDNEIYAGNADDVTITTGTGADVIRVHGQSGTGDAVVVAGAGDDTVYVDNELNTGDAINGGDGTDQLVMDGLLAVTATTDLNADFEGLFTNFESVKFHELSGTVDMAYVDDIQNVALGGYSLSNSTIKGLSSGATLEYMSYYGNASAITTVTLTDTTATETFNVNLYGNGDGADDFYGEDGNYYDETERDTDFGTLSLLGVETLNIDTATRCKDFDVTDADGTKDGIDVSFIDYALDINADALKTLNVTGDVALDMKYAALTTVTTIAAGTFTGDLSVTVAGNNNAVTITSGTGDDWIVGGTKADVINAGAGDNFVSGEAGNDSITAGAGDDKLLGEDGDDTIVAGDGDNFVDGGLGNDSITAGAGDDFIYGQGGNDTIVTGAGIDHVYGGLGLDTITIGADLASNDIDTIYYNAVGESQGTTVDVITGFQVNAQATVDILIDNIVDAKDVINDIIDLSDIQIGFLDDKGTVLTTDDVFVSTLFVYAGEAIGYGAVLTTLDTTGAESRAVLDSTTSILYIDIDASGTLDDADMAIKLVGVTALDADGANFIVNVPV
jgi:Ca2+-binding RTX toxin-like protein